MKVELKLVPKDEKQILRNLLEKYDYEFSQWDKREVGPLGLFDYSYLDYYWVEEKRWPFFILADGKLAGFVMVNDYPEAENEPTDYVIAEFFVMYPFRRHGVGQKAAELAFDRFHGRWQLKRHPHNIGSVHFWNRVVAQYTHGDYRLVEGYPGTEYDDGTPGDVFFFDNSRPKAND